MKKPTSKYQSLLGEIIAIKGFAEDCLLEYELSDEEVENLKQVRGILRRLDKLASEKTNERNSR